MYADVTIKRMTIAVMPHVMELQYMPREDALNNSNRQFANCLPFARFIAIRGSLHSFRWLRVLII